MKKYLVSVSCKFNEVNRIDNKIITTSTPLSELWKLFPGFVIQRGNSWNWHIAFWNRVTNTHLYYIIKPK